MKAPTTAIEPLRSEAAVPPRVVLALAAAAALLAAIVPGTDAGAPRFPWQSGPASSLAGVAAALAFVVLGAASWGVGGRGMGLLGGAVALFAAVLLGVADRGRSGSLLVAAASIASIGCVTLVAEPRGLRTETIVHAPRRAPAGVSRANLGAGAGIAVVSLLLLARAGRQAPAALPPPPALASIVTLALGVAIFAAGAIGRSGDADGGTRTARAASVALALGLLLAVETVVAPLLGGDRSTALESARASMLAVTASIAVGSLLRSAPTPPPPEAPHRPAHPERSHGIH